MMVNEVAHRDEAGPLATGPGTSSSGLIAGLLAMAKDPSVDAEKVKTLADLAVTLQDREMKAEFQRDLNAAMMKMPVITREGRIEIRDDKGALKRVQGKFARYEDIDRVGRPILRDHRLAIRFDIGESNGAVTVTPILSHANGYEHVGKEMRLPIENSGSKNNVQGVGSSIAYGKRYAYCAALNIVTEGIDDDGNQGRGSLVTLPFEREETVRREAEEAARAGRYIDWFGTQSPKDRAWLVASGLHEKHGGQPALPVTERPAASEPDPPPPPPPPPSPPPAATTSEESGKTKRTPRQWVDEFKVAVGKSQTVGFLDEFMDGKRDALAKLQGSDPALWEETQQAYRERKAAIEEGRLV